MDAPESQEQGAAAPPLGITPDFEDPPNRNSQILAVAGFTIAISTLFVGLRTYTRLVLIKRHGWEDCEYTALLRTCMRSLTCYRLAMDIMGTQPEPEFNWSRL